MIPALALLLGLVLAPLQLPGTGVIRGEVRSEATGAPLPDATVEVRVGAMVRSAGTDRTGAYALRAVPHGRRVLRVSRIGYDPLEVEVLVPSGAEVNLDLALRIRPVPVAEVAIRGRAVTAIESDSLAPRPPALELAGIRALESAPGIAELGLGDASYGSSGQAPVDPSDVLYVRGVATDLKLVLLDGAPVFTPFHMGGLLDSFEPDVLRSATLYLGGAPARYDGGLSYILDISTRAGRDGRIRSAGAVDLMSSRAVVEGPAGERVRYLLGGRAVHGLGAGPLLRASLPYDYLEGLARVDAQVGDGVLSMTAFRNQEGLTFDSATARLSEAAWGNTALSMRYRTLLGSTDAEITAAYGGFEAEMPVAGTRPLPTHGSNGRVRLTGDFARPAGAALLRYGASFEQLSLRQEARFRQGSTGPPAWESETRGGTVGAYTEAAWQIAPRLRIRGGLRGDVFDADPSPRFAPRLSATWLLSDRAALTAAAGRYHQYVRGPSAALVLHDAASTDTIFLPTGIAVGRASHLNLALHQELDEGVRLGVEGFFKTFEGVPEPHVERSHASGADLWVRRETGRVRGWLGYSLSWVWSLPSGGAPADPVHGSATGMFAGRQLLNVGATGSLGRWGDVELRFAYGAGLPFTTIFPNTDLATPGSPVIRATGASERQFEGAGDSPAIPAPPSEPYLRLDVGVSRTFDLRWRDTPFEISPYLRVLNSLDRRDALFYWYDRDRNPDPRPVGALPVLPLLGVQWKF
ncbi:TonB-dependent receptor [soil metagenome]